MADDRTELQELRRIDELERKAGGQTTGGGAALVPPKGKITPASPETISRVSEITDWLTESPTKEDVDFGQVAETGGVGAAIGYGAPKALKYGGKLLGRAPGWLGATGKASEALGTALEKIPPLKRTLGGGGGAAAGETTQQASEYMGIPRAIGIPASLAVGGTVTKGIDYLEKAVGLQAGSLSKTLRESGVEKAKDMLQKAGLSKQQAEKELSSAQLAERQLSEQQIKARERGEQRVLPPEQAIKQTVAQKAKQASSMALQNASDAKIAVDKAEAMAREASEGVVAANNAVNQLEKKLIAQPQLSKEKFGAQLQETTNKLLNDYSKLRKSESKIASVIENSKSSISTKGINDLADNYLKDIRNPALQRVLLEVKSQSLTDNNQVLSLKSADSLKGYLDSIINAKQFADTKLDKETLNIVRDIKKSLVQTMTTTSTEYRDALARFRSLSRPLDIVERNGALAKVPEKDPFSLEYKMAEASVVGNIIAKAKAGNPVFTRLIKENPDIKDSARLYFTKELFGQGEAPTPRSLTTFLKDNESPLRQLGLYEEFKDIRSAQRAAQQAVDEAKETEKVAKGVVTGKGKELTAAKQEATRLGNLSDEAARRVTQLEPLEDILKRSAARAKPAQTAVAQRISKAEKTIGQQEAIQKEFTTFLNDISKAKPNEVPTMISNMADNLFKGKGAISEEERNYLVNEATRNIDQFKEKSRARNILTGLAVGIGVPALGLKFYGPSIGGQ